MEVIMEEKKVKFGWGLDQTHCEPDMYDTVEELLEAAQASWDNMDGNPFDEDQEYDGGIFVGTAEAFESADFAPSISDIAEQMTDRFYCDHNIDENVDVQVYNAKEAEEAWKEFVNKYFDLPCSMTVTWTIGVYDLKEHKWVEKYGAFDKYVKEDEE